MSPLLERTPDQNATKAILCLYTGAAILHLYTGTMMRDLTVEQSKLPAYKQIKCSSVN